MLPTFIILGSDYLETRQALGPDPKTERKVQHGWICLCFCGTSYKLVVAEPCRVLPAEGDVVSQSHPAIKQWEEYEESWATILPEEWVAQVRTSEVSHQSSWASLGGKWVANVQLWIDHEELAVFLREPLKLLSFYFEDWEILRPLFGKGSRTELGLGDQQAGIGFLGKSWRDSMHGHCNR